MDCTAKVSFKVFPVWEKYIGMVNHSKGSGIQKRNWLIITDEGHWRCGEMQEMRKKEKATSKRLKEKKEEIKEKVKSECPKSKRE